MFIWLLSVTAALGVGYFFKFNSYQQMVFTCLFAICLYLDSILEKLK